MESVTHREFEESCNKATGVLFAIIVYCIYSYFKYGYNTLNAITLISSILCIIGVKRLLIIGLKATDNIDFKIGFLDSIFLSNIIIMLLGVLSIYIFAYKGVYGLYKSFDPFSIWSTVFHLGITLFAFQLVSATSKIQTVFKAIKANTITRY